MDKLIVSPSPHQKNSITTQKVMLMVIISLIPAIAASSFIFGPRALLLILTCVVSCVFFEFITRMIMKRSNTISDLSAVVTGIILALNLPVTLPFWMATIGSFIAIVIVKQLFGGIGQNFANPAIVARIVLMLSFTTEMTRWVKPFWYKTADIVTSPTPLSDTLSSRPSLKEMFLGTTGGSLGETCALALLIGGLFLVVVRVIKLSTPLSFLATLGICTIFYNLLQGTSIGFASYEALYQILAGGAVLGAFFMATDYATTPVTTKGKVIFGIGCGLITFLIRQFANAPEGVSFSILIMNIVTPYIDEFTRTKPLGAKKQIKGAVKNA